jgi:hypothetical protein
MAFNCGCGQRMYCTDSKGRTAFYVYRRYRCRACGATIRTEERMVEDASMKRRYEKWNGEQWVTTTIREMRLHRLHRAALQAGKVLEVGGVQVRMIQQESGHE